MKVLVLGAAGMIGNAIFRVLSEDIHLQVYGTIRSQESKSYFDVSTRNHLLLVPDLLQQDQLVSLFVKIRPEVVINCVGVVKQLPEAEEPLVALPLNSILPHRLAQMCAMLSARFIHLSTDCVFSGSKGMYEETDITDASDLYGRSKALGEVCNNNSITLRTSTIGYELQHSKGLLEWFFLQKGKCKGFRNAIFSGLPSVILAEVIRDYVIPNNLLTGLYHVASQPISKFDLLQIIANVYNIDIEIIPDDVVRVDRSLDTKSFQLATGYIAPCWMNLIETMKSHELRMSKNVYR